MESIGPGVARAIEFLKEFVKESPSVIRLPAIAFLASQAGVSASTMLKAAKHLKKEGVLEGIQGQRFAIAVNLANANNRAEDINNESDAPLWRRVKQAIERDILNGAYRRGREFPSFKQLQVRYNACYVTVKKAIEALIREKILERRGRGHAVCAYAVPRQAHSRIVLVALGKPGGMPGVGIQGQEFIRTLEAECSRAGVELVKTVFGFEDDDVVYSDYDTGKQCELAAGESVIGYLYPAVSPFFPWESVLKQLTRYRKPVAIMEQVGGLSISPGLPNRRYVRQFSVGTVERPGFKIGQYLLSLGHNHVAYISPFHASQWSHMRLRGLAGAYSHPDKQCSCRAFTVDKAPVDYPHDTCPRQLREKMKAGYAAMRSALPSAMRSRIRIAIAQRFRSIEWWGRVYAETAPHFNAALENKAMSAWVCANDWVAEMALEFLADKNIAVPAEISVVGFDDSEDALRLRLTSYNFNIPAVANAMMSYVVQPGFLSAFRSRTPVVTEGSVVVRATTAPRKSAKEKRIDASP